LNELSIANYVYQTNGRLGEVRTPLKGSIFCPFSYHFMTMKYIDGNVLCKIGKNKSIIINTQLSILTFHERANAFSTLLITLESLLNLKPNKGPILHRDLKPENVILTIEHHPGALSTHPTTNNSHEEILPRHLTKKLAESGSSSSSPPPAKALSAKRRAILSLVDFGLATHIPTATLSYLGATAGTVHTMTPEAAYNMQMGPRSEVYSLVSLLLILFGAHNPFLDKFLASNNLSQLPRIPYNFNGLFDGIIIPGKDTVLIKNLIETLAKRMESQEYDERPSFGEVVKFFLSLNQYCKYYEKIELVMSNNDTDTTHFNVPEKIAYIASVEKLIIVSLAKMALIVADLWHYTTSLKTAPNATPSKYALVRFFAEESIVAETLADYPLESNIPLCEAIIRAFKKNLLTADYIKFALKHYPHTPIAENNHEASSSESKKHRL
jgi:serine/threonine protein kinase